MAADMSNVMRTMINEEGFFEVFGTGRKQPNSLIT